VISGSLYQSKAGVSIAREYDETEGLSRHLHYHRTLAAHITVGLPPASRLGGDSYSAGSGYCYVAAFRELQGTAASLVQYFKHLRKEGRKLLIVEFLLNNGES